MSKKQEPIIIDDVNVAECQCFENNKCLWCKKYYESNVTPSCKEVKDCYFKKLQRLKQENEDLKYEIDRQKETILYLQNYDMCHKTLIEYKQALEEIKKETHRLLYQENPIYGYDDSNYFEFLAKFVIKKVKEVLNETK